jgi:putative nucleotidyltransferase with HDIG domain
MSQELSIDEIESNWLTYEKLCHRLSNHALNDMLEVMGERITMCPASTRLDQYGAHPGGLVKHSLEVASTMRAMNSGLDLDIDVSSIIKVALLHDIGKLGDLNEMLFLNQDSDWHKDKLGQMYKYNEKIQKMSVSHRGLFLLQLFDVSLTMSEWLAIQLAQGSHFEENRYYVGSAPGIALLLQQAKAQVINRSNRSS